MNQGDKEGVRDGAKQRGGGISKKGKVKGQDKRKREQKFFGRLYRNKHKVINTDCRSLSHPQMSKEC